MEKKIIFFIVASVAFAYLGLHFQPFLCNHSSWKPVLLMESKNCRNPRAGASRNALAPFSLGFGSGEGADNSRTYRDSPYKCSSTNLCSFPSFSFLKAISKQLRG